MTRTQTVQYLPFILTYLAQITLFPRSRPMCSASISLSLQFLYFASLPFLQRNAPCIFRMHHTRSYFQLCDKKYVYNGKQNKVNTIRFCVRPWYCDTDNRLPCFVFRAFYPITLWIIPDKSRTFNPAAAAAAIRGHTDWLTDSTVCHSRWCITNAKWVRLSAVISIRHIVGAMLLTFSFKQM